MMLFKQALLICAVVWSCQARRIKDVKHVDLVAQDAADPKANDKGTQRDKYADDSESDAGGPSSCEKMLGPFGKDVAALVVAFTESCGIAFSDLKGQAVSAAGSAKICSGGLKCLRSEAIAKGLPDLETLQAACSGHETVHVNVQMPFYNIASNLLTAWRTCNTDTETGGATPPAKETTEEDKCPSPATVSQDCGWHGITRKECTEKECCWDPSEREGRNWCYHKPGKQNSPSCWTGCPVHPGWQPQSRSDCQPFLILDQFTDPDPATRQQACQSVGCCWDQLSHGDKDPWCFYTPCLA